MLSAIKRVYVFHRFTRKLRKVSSRQMVKRYDFSNSSLPVNYSTFIYRYNIAKGDMEWMLKPDSKNSASGDGFDDYVQEIARFVTVCFLTLLYYKFIFVITYKELQLPI